MERPIFIVGPSRSGTTLLRSLLSAHSRIAIAPETHFLLRADRTEGLGREAPEDFGTFWKNYTAWVRFRDLGVDAGRCLDRIERQDGRTFRDVFQAVLEEYGELAGKERVGEKTPMHVRYLATLLDWFPRAHVLLMKRDPRAVVASQLQTPWARDRRRPFSLRGGLVQGKRLHQVAQWADEWRSVYSRILPCWEEDPRVHLVAYEALVQDPDTELRSVCAFIEEAFEPSMLTERGSTLPEGTRSIKDEAWRTWRQDHHTQAAQAVSTAPLEKWKGELSALEVALVEGRCRGGMREAGYSFATPPLQRSAGAALAEALLRTEQGEAWSRAAVRAGRRRLRPSNLRRLREAAGAGR